jgi:hypothetical protein
MMVVQDSTFSANRTEGPYAQGGCLFALDTAQLTRSTVTGNGTTGTGRMAAVRRRR